MTNDSPPLQLSKAHSLITQRTTDLSQSYLFSIDKDITLLSSGKFDIYNIIAKASTVAYFNLYDILAFVSFGWAAPTKDEDIDTPPSAHPEKRRIRLTNYLYTQEINIVSCIDILNRDLTIQESIWELDGHTSGPLKDNLIQLYNR